MKRITFMIWGVMSAAIAGAQTANPFASIGKEAEVVSLSGGRYAETFDDAVLQRIGSVVIDTRTNRVVQLLDADSLGDVTADNSTASRWLSVDPLATQYPSFSPYVFAGNNPIVFFDPDGAKILNGNKEQAKRDLGAIAIYQPMVDDLIAKYGNVGKKDFPGSANEWKYYKGMKQRLSDAKASYGYNSGQVAKTDELMASWQARSPKLFEKLDNQKNAQGEQVDMMLTTKDLFSVDRGDAMNGGNTYADFKVDDNGVIRPTSKFGTNQIEVEIEESASDRNYFLQEYGIYVENHEAGHFEYFAEHAAEYKQYKDEHNGDTKGGHNKDDKSGQKAVEYEKIRDIK